TWPWTRRVARELYSCLRQAPIRRFGVRRGERRYKCLRFAWQRLADEIADKPADDDVLAELRNFGTQQILDGHIRILNKALFEQANGAVEFLEFSIDNFVGNVLRFAFDLSFINFALSFD